MGNWDQAAFIKAKQAERERLAAQGAASTDPPDSGYEAASAGDAAKAAWDFGRDFSGAAHRGGAELEALKLEMIGADHTSWPYNLDFGPEQNAAKIPSRLAKRGLRDFDTYQYLVLTGAEYSEHEREKMFGIVNIPAFLKRPDIALAVQALATGGDQAVSGMELILGEAKKIQAGASSGAFAITQHDSVLWDLFYSLNSFEACYREYRRQSIAKSGTPGAGASGGDPSSVGGASGASGGPKG